MPLYPVCDKNSVCVHDSDFSYIVPPLDGDQRLFFYESAVNTFILKESEIKDYRNKKTVHSYTYEWERLQHAIWRSSPAF